MHSWTVYHIASKLKFVGTVHDAPDAQTAIERAIAGYQVPPDERGALFALRRD